MAAPMPFNLPSALEQAAPVAKKLHQYWIIIDFVHGHILDAAGAPREYIEVAGEFMEAFKFRKRSSTAEQDEDLMFSAQVYEWMVAMHCHGTLTMAMEGIENLRQSRIEGLLALGNSQNKMYHGFVQSEHEFRALMVQFRERNNDEVDCPDFPTGDDGGQKALVKELYDAMLDCDPDIVRSFSKEARKQGAERARELDPQEVAGTAFIRRLKDVERELLCWEILFAARDMQMKKANILQWSNGSFTYKGFDTFRERWDAIVCLLRTCKAAIPDITTVPQLMKVVANPELEAEGRGLDIFE
ncbi:hypothetical protein B0T25DRAFT_568118 [Lasiosphaeria hispida]|uniref:Uncharacterized protein n=1 Tax=Lasiosphaeria hispida TaxID=260671 RepID=A0AAJ0MDW1_9PEZI|nr:hypothetical protein B0T25DRAFT_568118 [Lasiosphaeria hispida]